MARRKNLRNLLFAVLILAALGCFWGCGGSPASASMRPPVQTSLTISATTVDFGDVTVGSSTTKTVTVSNPSTASVSVKSATVSGSDFTITGATFPTTLEAGSSVTLTLKFAPTAMGSATGSVVIDSDATVAAPTVNLSGSGVGSTSSPTLGMSTSSIAFTTVNVGSSARNTVTLTNSSTTTAIHVSAASVTGTGYTVHGVTLPFTVPASGSQVVTVQFAPTAAGPDPGTVSFVSDAVNSPTTITLTGSGALPPAALGVSPTSLPFGTVTVGNTKTLTVTLTNASTTTPITVDSATASGSGYSVSGATYPFTLTAGGSKTLTVRFAPTSAGTANGTMVISSDASNPSVTVTLAGAGQLPAATLGVSPTSLSFGTVTVGNSKSLTVTLSNPSSTTPIVVSSATATGSGYSVSGATYPLTLSAGGSKALTVKLEPTAAGTANGTMVIASDASNPSVSVTLTGTGQAATAALTVSPTSLNFGTITIGASLAKSVVLTNSSTSVTITVDSASFTGSEYTVSGATFPFTLATGGGNKTLQITFKPAASGTASDTLSIVSNANNSPTSVAVTGDGQAPPSHEVDLSWEASTSPVIGYNVYRSGTKGGPYTMINSTLATSAGFADTDVTAGSTYYYVVTAMDSSNVESDPSNEAPATVPSP